MSRAYRAGRAFLATVGAFVVGLFVAGMWATRNDVRKIARENADRDSAVQHIGRAEGPFRFPPGGLSGDVFDGTRWVYVGDMQVQATDTGEQNPFGAVHIWGGNDG